MKCITPDKYAQDARAWKDLADTNYAASKTLFIHAMEKPTLYFVAVALGHLALEMLLKTALICKGMTVFNPKHLKSLDPLIDLKESDCVWGHGLVELARTLAQRDAGFDLSAKLPFCGVVFETPLTVEEGFELFAPFFSELRYPQELKKIVGFGGEESCLLEELACYIEPFIAI